ncbi:MAG TPA: LacI family DNA-binding transcriptional regulator [Niabella sp.]|nr:LacI family DNA-binding transcriptional regulator [Niabella sp.]
MKDKIPTIKEIADKLKVSVSTVSRALHDHPRIGMKTKEAVKKLAKELNFEPNPKAIFFKQKKSFVIGVVVPRINEDFFSRAITGMETLAMDKGYTILFGQSHDSYEKEKKVLEAMKKQRVDGLIISLSKETNKYEHLNELNKYDIPIVYFDRVPKMKNVNKVYCNLSKATEDLIDWLHKKGKRRIALINGPDEIIASKERLEGYIEGISKKKIKVDMQLVEQTDLTEGGTYTAMEKLFTTKKQPDAVITFNDYVHFDAAQWAFNHGIKINKDVIFASFANILLMKYAAFPPAVSIDQFPNQQGYEAMHALLEILDKPEDNEQVRKSFFDKEMPAVMVFH